MMPKPLADIKPNTLEFEILPLVKPTGFREYDARWWFGHPGSEQPPQINLYGIQALGLGLGTLIHELGKEPKIVTGHDFRSYSLSVKQALEVGDRTVMLHQGQVVFDIAGKDREGLEVKDLLGLFEKQRGLQVDDDSLLLG